MINLKSSIFFKKHKSEGHLDANITGIHEDRHGAYFIRSNDLLIDQLLKHD